MRRLLRTFALVAFALAAWLISAPAAAAGAGLCSHRGASEVAPSPLLMPAQSSLEEADASYCGGEWQKDAVQRGEDRSPGSSPAPDAVLPNRVALYGAAVTNVKRAPTHDLGRAAALGRLERPPRA